MGALVLINGTELLKYDSGLILQLEVMECQLFLDLQLIDWMIMAKTEGYVQLVCDRCSKTVYAQMNSPEYQTWRNIKRISADNVEVSRLLCKDCYSEYREMCTTQDTQFGDFMTKSEEQ